MSSAQTRPRTPLRSRRLRAFVAVAGVTALSWGLFSAAAPAGAQNEPAQPSTCPSLNALQESPGATEEPGAPGVAPPNDQAAPPSDENAAPPDNAGGGDQGGGPAGGGTTADNGNAAGGGNAGGSNAGGNGAGGNAGGGNAGGGNAGGGNAGGNGGGGNGNAAGGGQGGGGQSGGNGGGQSGGNSGGNGNQNPPGNNGTVKIDGIDIDSPGNVPHVSCTFVLEFINFDTGQVANVAFEEQAPTLDVGLTVDGPSVVDLGSTPADGTTDARVPYTLSFTQATTNPQGYHVRLNITSDGLPGNGRKHKVFWVSGECGPAPTATATATEPTEPTEPTGTGTATEPTEPTEPTGTGTGTAIEPTEPTGPTQTQPTGPTQTQPTGPTQTQPTGPSVGPTGSEQTTPGGGGTAPGGESTTPGGAPGGLGKCTRPEAAAAAPGGHAGAAPGGHAGAAPGGNAGTAPRGGTQAERAPQGTTPGTQGKNAAGGPSTSQVPRRVAAGVTASTRQPAASASPQVRTRHGVVRVDVPALDIHAGVLPIGARHGVLTPPSDTQALGWWRAGAAPGATNGAVVVVGHSVHAGVGVFDRLGTLQPGARVTVRTQAAAVRYRVSGVEVYGKQSLARRASRLFRQNGPARLVMVTCAGWNGSRYLSNVVVVADPM